MTRTKVSTKGQVILPKAIRDALNWPPGTELEVRREGTGVTLVPAGRAKTKTLDDLIGVLKYDGPPVTLEDMQRGIDEAMAERWARKSKT
jgi:AbrB family looped-hinge helix DNA binding protein